MPSLAELTDQYPQQDTSLPVTQPYRGANLGPLQPVTFAPIGNTQLVVPAASDVVAQPDPNSVGANDDSWLTKINNAAKKFTNYDRQMTEDVINLPKTISNMSSADDSQIIDKLLGLGGQERYQLWPEKVIRDAISAPHDIIQANPYPEGSEEASWFEDQRGKDMVPAALNMSALAGTGGLAGTGAELGEAVGSGPFLRPALKVGDKIYKAPIKDAENPLGFGAEHSDALPAHLADDFYKKAMNGEDINHYNFGFVNHKGQFLDRSKALDYGIEQGLVDPSNGKYGVLTSTMLADSSKPGTAIEAMAKSSQPFYSALEHNVNAIQQPKMTGDQWLGTLANKPGVKPEELDWTGVKDFLKERGNQPVTKQELQEHLQNNKVELKEVDKREPEQSRNVGYVPDEDKTKYHSYQLPGGENYREKLLTLPKTVKDNVSPSETASAKYLPEWNKLVEEDKRLRPLVDDYNRRLSGEEWNKARDDLAVNNKKMDELHNRMVEDTMKENPLRYGDPYKSSHWDEPNILAHVRMNDRIIDGKKSLHLEEIQSDWHQQGKKAGYKELNANEQKELDQLTKREINPNHLNPLNDQEKIRIVDLEKRNGDLPNAPFKKTWHELALKRMIREAAEKGYDRLSWTPGESQAARYDLSKSIDKLAYNPSTGHLQGFKDGRMALDNANVPKDKLPDFVGKEAADKILNKPTSKVGLNGSYHQLENADLKIGGEGMKGFYDQIIPKSLEKISGEKVKTTNLPVAPKEFKKEWLNLPPEEKAKLGQPVHYIDIPQSLKDKALGKGFPLFSSTHIFTPVSHNPFSNEKKK